MNNNETTYQRIVYNKTCTFSEKIAVAHPVPWTQV